MTARAFAEKCGGKKDGWINAIKKGRNSLKLEHLDTVAHVLRMTTGDLVREGNAGWDLRPTELRVVQALRLLPFALQDRTRRGEG